MAGEAKRTISRAQWLRRLASRRRDKTAFVLSGGGPFGALQVGMLRALLERGIVPDMAVGTSVGGLNAAFLALDPTIEGVGRLADLWEEIEDEVLFPGARFKASWARMVMRGNRVFDNGPFRRFIEERLPVGRIEDARIPLGIVATDLDTGEDEVFTSGPMVDTLLASAAMPGIYPPVVIGGHTYIDGGVTNAVPIAPAVEMG
ncbi:MAG TPA: patatin-like phospholipase family protein, partial [Actinomycetota bacterium]|nr:patatin-like phospholipase family protein [Actinomycetota bacterium]